MTHANDENPKTQKKPRDLSAEDIRQGRIVLTTTTRKIVFFGGLTLLALVLILLRFA